VERNRLKLLLCGHQIVDDKKLINPLKKKYELYIARNLQNCNKILAGKPISLIVFEFSNERQSQLKMLKLWKTKYANIIVIVVNGKKNVHSVVELFNAGASDVFPMPYNAELLVERVEALLK